MPRLEAVLFTALTTGSPLTSAGVRVYPTNAPELAPLPRVTYQRIATEPQNSLGGHARIDRVNIQIDCWADTMAKAATLAKEVRLLLAGQSFKPLVQNEYTGFEGESRLYRHTLDVSCWDKDF